MWTTGGLVPIEKIQPGDWVLAFNETTGDSEYRVVTDTITTPGTALLDVTVQHSDGRIETIRTTDEHPFWVINGEQAAGASSGRWGRADQLQPGDTLTTLSGPATVTRVRYTQERQTVYNFTVEGLHTYHVGDDGVVVHNACTIFRKLFEKHLADSGRTLPSTYPVHHRIPQKYRDLFPDGRVDNLTNWAGVPKEVHWQINGRWNTFRATNRNPTAADVETFAAKVDAEFMSHYLLP